MLRYQTLYFWNSLYFLSERVNCNKNSRNLSKLVHIERLSFLFNYCCKTWFFIHKQTTSIHLFITLAIANDSSLPRLLEAILLALLLSGTLIVSADSIRAKLYIEKQCKCKHTSCCTAHPSFKLQIFMSKPFLLRYLNDSQSLRCFQFEKF